ncbi:MAG: 4-hydroxy-tetrahydrodipicolinate reductase [Candidatus Acidiferrum sp.]
MSQGLAIIGYGKMGRLIAQLAPEYGFDVRATFTSATMASLSAATLDGATVAVEFTAPAAAPENLRRLAALGINTVSGTTGWFDCLPSVRESVLRANSALVYSANFSIGVNLFLQIVAEAAARFSRHSDYEAWGWEIHHRAKKDAPSGTLLRLQEEIQANGFSRPVALSSSRAGSHLGTHEIGFDSPADTITLRHTARSREGFARGALQAARWLAGKKGVFEFREILGELSAVKSADFADQVL